MNCIAIDDEPLALQLIQSYVDRIDDLKLKATFTDALLAKDYLLENPVDLIFLDIQMPDINGIDFYKELLEKPSAVVFTTAYSEYAVEGFNLNADDYLVKPFEFSRFETAVNRVKDNIEAIKLKENEEGNLVVKYNYQFTKIAFGDIYYIEALDDYIKIHTDNKSYLIHMSMKAVSNDLPEDKFARIHRSYIVNCDKVNSWNKNSLQIFDTTLPISTSFQKTVMQMLEKK